MKSKTWWKLRRDKFNLLRKSKYSKTRVRRILTIIAMQRFKNCQIFLP